MKILITGVLGVVGSKLEEVLLQRQTSLLKQSF